MSVEINTDEFKAGLDLVRDRYDQAFAVAKNMIASMMRAGVAADIQGAGNFGNRFLETLTVTVDGDTITTKITAPGADIFETGGTIHGHPLLWIPISGTDAVGIEAGDYGGKLFSVNRKAGGPPLLFSVKDHAPKYFGVPSVTIPKKFHIEDVQARVMGDLKEIFDNALGAANG